MRGLCAIRVVAIALMAWTGAAAQETKSGTNGTVTPDDYRIGPEGVLQVFVGKKETLSRTVSVRPDGGKMKRIPFNFNKAISEGCEQENFYVQDGDIVVVP